MPELALVWVTKKLDTHSSQWLVSRSPDNLSQDREFLSRTLVFKDKD